MLKKLIFTTLYPSISVPSVQHTWRDSSIFLSVQKSVHAPIPAYPKILPRPQGDQRGRVWLFSQIYIILARVVNYINHHFTYIIIDPPHFFQNKLIITWPSCKTSSRVFKCLPIYFDPGILLLGSITP